MRLNTKAIGRGEPAPPERGGPEGRSYLPVEASVLMSSCIVSSMV